MKTLNELIEEELVKGKQLGTDLKVSNSSWQHGYFFVPHFKDAGGIWRGLDQNQEYGYYTSNNKTWHPYTEPKKKKKYWLWNLKDIDGAWYKTRVYYNDVGLDTSGNDFHSNWDDVKKQKLENEYIEIEVEDE